MVYILDCYAEADLQDNCLCKVEGGYQKKPEVLPFVALEVSFRVQNMFTMQISVYLGNNMYNIVDKYHA